MATQEIEEILEHVGIRPTAVRIVVYKALTGMHDTFSLSDMENMLPSVDKSSLFRALTLFAEHHLVHPVDDGSGSLKYCICHNHGDCDHDEQHLHFYCEACNKTFCLEDGVIPEIKLPDGFKAHSMNFVIKGICPACDRAKR